jgi:hypothetical protein
MTPSIVVALIASVASLAAAAFAYQSQRRVALLNAELEEGRRKRTKRELAEELTARYRDPLLAAVFDLQGRLHGIVALDFMRRYYAEGDQWARRYAIENTLYVVAEYFAWVEIIRREIQFLELGEETANERWVDAINRVRDVFASHKMDSALHIFRGDQRAIGEVMTATVTESGAARRHDCIGYAAFVVRREDPEFARWFGKLEQDVTLLACERDAHLDRVILLQRALVDIIEILDERCTRYPRAIRTKLDLPLGKA